jgi:DNA polymerase-3 subunit delta
MKISYPQLAAHLTKELHPVYLICTDDILLSYDATSEIRKKARAEGFSERVLIEGHTDFEEVLYENSHSLSLFALKKIIELNFQQHTLKSAQGKILDDYAKNPAENTLLIVRASKLDSTMEKSAWFKSLVKKVVVVQIWPVSVEQLPTWIIERAKKHSLHITMEASVLLAAKVEGNLLAADQEIEKLGLLAVAQKIDRALIENVATDNAQYDVFNLVESSLGGHKARALHILKNLQGNIEPTLILWALTRELRILASLFVEIKNNALPSLFDKFRIFGKRQHSVKAFMQRHKMEHCWEFLLDAAAIDRMIKGVEEGHVWEKLQDLSIKIASGK